MECNMVFKRKMFLELSSADFSLLQMIVSEYNQIESTLKRANILIDHYNRKAVCSIAKQYDVSRKTIENLVKRTNRLGVQQSVFGTLRPGRPKKITHEEDRWIYSISRTDYRELNKLEEMSYVDLTNEIRKRCIKEGFSSLKNISVSTVYNIVRRLDQKSFESLSDQIIMFTIFQFALANEKRLIIKPYNLENRLERLNSPYLFTIIDITKKRCYTKIDINLSVKTIIEIFDDFLDRCNTVKRIIVKSKTYPILKHPNFGKYLRDNQNTFIFDYQYNFYDSYIIDLIESRINNSIKNLGHSAEDLWDKVNKSLKRINDS